MFDSCIARILMESNIFIFATVEKNIPHEELLKNVFGEFISTNCFYFNQHIFLHWMGVLHWSGKFVYAYGDVIPQKAYYVGSVADKMYCNPKGGVDWRGFAVQLAFLKKTLEKLEIQPQIFYAGKFKSATEPFREVKMT